MSRFALVFFVLFSAIFINTTGYCQPKDNSYVTDLNVALKLSRETQQKIVLIFSADWCGHCRDLKRDFSSIKEFDNKIVCILDSDVEKKLSRQFKAKSLPTSIMLNTNGEEIARITGYDKASYSKWLGVQK